jgi:hypothetical protein
MKNILFQIFSGVCLISILMVTGCVAPPQEIATSGPTDLYDPNQFATTTPVGQNPGLLATATPFQTTGTPTLAYNVLKTQTPIPEDMVCLIDIATFNATLEINRTAKTFDLKNPPMYVNYSIIKQYNVTGTRISTSKTGKKIEVTTTYEYFNPIAYLDITVRNPTTGEIYQQDGFGKGYGSTTNKTIQITKSGDLLIEISAFNTTPGLGFWVKPSGNLNSDIINISSLECRSQDYVKRLNQ